MKKPLVVDARGSNYELGLTVGRAARTLLEKALAGYRRSLKAEGLGEPWGMPEIYLDKTKETFPHLVEELQGIADGSGLTFKELFFLNALEEALDQKPQQACSAVGLYANGQAWLGHNEDWYATDRDTVIVIRGRPKNKPAFVSVTAAPFLAAVGMNEAGLAQGVNSVDSIDNRPGIPRMFSARAVLEATTLDEAKQNAAPADRAGGYNYLLVSSDGRLGNFETTATETDFLPASSVACHTNHYISPRLMPLACPATEHSKFRYRRLTELVEHISGAGAINSFSLLKNILSDHQNRPLSICRHENEQPDHNATIFSVIIDLNQRKLGVAVGNPCDNMFTEVPL